MIEIANSATIRPQSPARILLTRILTHRLGLIGIIVLSIAAGLSLLAPFVAPYSPIEIGAGDILQPPGGPFWFGTDELGRDVLSRVLHGGRISIQLVGIAVMLAFILGTALGVVSGYFAGKTDAIIMRITDAMLAFPALILALSIIALLGPSLFNAMIAVAIINVSGFTRLVRGQVLSLRNIDFVRAAYLLGAGDARIMARHVLPNVTGNLIVFGSLIASQALITEAGLSFLGLGAQPPTPSWGLMIATGVEYAEYWWMSFFPGVAIFLVVLSLNFIGDAVRDSLDARSRGMRGDQR
ncbi:MAG: ABC transporter permease [Alphaproteobacteria bacterium]|nr:ABC transporter permease [Alphaproteobacteria bacterium]